MSHFSSLATFSSPNGPDSRTTTKLFFSSATISTFRDSRCTPLSILVITLPAPLCFWQTMFNLAQSSCTFLSTSMFVCECQDQQELRTYIICNVSWIILWLLNLMSYGIKAVDLNLLVFQISVAVGIDHKHVRYPHWRWFWIPAASFYTLPKPMLCSLALPLMDLLAWCIAYVAWTCWQIIALPWHTLVRTEENTVECTYKYKQEANDQLRILLYRNTSYKV